ncbi:MAG: CopD family protein [Proteobacteria bacterium]|nr:CopD family protein [Pseudomonadota bacterium]
MIDAAWLLLRAGVFVLVLKAAGLATFMAFQAPDLTPAGLRRVRLLTRITAACGLLAVLVQALAEPVHLAGSVAGLSDPMLRRLAWFSAAAAVPLLRLAGLLLLWVGARRPHAGMPVIAALLLGGSFLASGHALTDTHRLLLLPLLALHVLGAAFWFGAVAAFLSLMLSGEGPPVPALGAFSRRAVRLVPLMGLAGVAMALVLLPDFAALARPYGLLLLAKALLFTGVLALAAVNRGRLLPALREGRARARGAVLAVLSAEYVLLLAAIVVAALMTGAFSPYDP